MLTLEVAWALRFPSTSRGGANFGARAHPTQGPLFGAVRHHRPLSSRESFERNITTITSSRRSSYSSLRPSAPWAPFTRHLSLSSDF